MPDDNHTGASPGNAKLIKVEGHVQGLVIGDHNTVIQHFDVKQPAFPTPRESPRLAAQVYGRDQLIEETSGALLANTAERVIVLCGMGGMGKSTLASHVATLPDLEAEFSDGCFWVDLQNGDSMEALARMAQAFGQNVDAYDNIGSRSRALRSILHQKRVLIVVDNAWDEPGVEPFLAQGPQVAVLVTTRDESLAYLLSERVVHVGRLGAADALNMLAQLSGQSVAPNSEQDMAMLVEDLGGLPLALELVARQARKESRRPGFSWQRLRERLQQGEKRLGLGHGHHTVRNAFEQTWQRALDTEAQRRFAMLGMFPLNDLLSGEIAAAWNAADQAALDQLAELLDLSLLRQIDEVTVRLHPLLKDFAIEKLRDIDLQQRVSAHQRVFDFHYQRAADRPVTMEDMQPVLSAHYHAAKAEDSERAKRVFPWFDKSSDSTVDSTAVPGFLIDHGHQITLVEHYRLELELLKNNNAQVRAWAEYRLGDALASVGDLANALEHLQTALGLAESSDLIEDARNMDRAKFSYRIGQVCVEMQDYAGAIAAYHTALEMDRKMEQAQSALITMLQIADLHLHRNEADDLGAAIDLIEQARDQAQAQHYPAEEAMALTRLADLTAQSAPQQSAGYIEAALALETSRQHNRLDPSTTFEVSAFSGRQGARYASTLGQIAAQHALNNDLQMMRAALRAYSIAVHEAGKAASWYEQSITFYWLGNLLEHLFLIDGYQPERPAAWACYAIAERTTQGMQLPPGINPAARIETRILPQLDQQQQQQLTAAIETEPLPIIQQAVDKVSATPLWPGEIRLLG